MTIKDLKEFIKELPDNMEIIKTEMSDFQELELGDLSILRAIPKQEPRYANLNRGFIMRYHPSDNIEGSKLYLHFAGN